MNYDDFNFTPKTHSVPAGRIRVNHIVMESSEYPVRITRISKARGVLYLWGRYIWQASADPEWLLGWFYAETKVEKAYS